MMTTMTNMRPQLLGGLPGNVDRAIRALAAAGLQLPDELATANRALQAIAGRKRQAALPAPTPDDDAERIVAAAIAGEPFPDDLAQHGAQAYLARESQTHTKRAWAVALDRATANRDMAFNRAGLALYDALGERLDAVLADAQHVASGLGGLNPGDPATLARDERALGAYPLLAALAEQYGLIRAAQVQLRPFLGNPKVDKAEHFAELRNTASLLGTERWARRADLATIAGPTEPIERLCWLVAGDAQPWLPTPEQQDAAYAEDAARLDDVDEEAFQRRVDEAAERGEMLRREGTTREQWRANERVQRQRAGGQPSR